MVILESKRKSSKRKYKSPYDNFRGTKEELIAHVDENFEDMIPEGYSATRVVFNHIYKKDHGTCVICGDETEWDEERGKYKRLCNKNSCREEFRERFKKNMVNVHGKTTLLNDMDHQQKMLANRKISGSYKFRDGGVRTYTGSYEKKALEFMDKVLNINSKDIITPGPVFEYEYKGNVHQFITDIYYIPYNLIFDVKDGGSNKNTHPNLKEFREKQEAKEKAIKEAGTHNYIRLTDNDFSQLLNVFAELKMNLINDDEKPVIHINENMRSKESDDKFLVMIGEHGIITEREYVKDLSLIQNRDASDYLVFNVREVPANITEMTTEEIIYDPRFEYVELSEAVLPVHKDFQLIGGLYGDNRFDIQYYKYLKDVLSTVPIGFMDRLSRADRQLALAELNTILVQIKDIHMNSRMTQIYPDEVSKSILAMDPSKTKYDEYYMFDHPILKWNIEDNYVLYNVEGNLISDNADRAYEDFKKVFGNFNQTAAMTRPQRTDVLRKICSICEIFELVVKSNGYTSIDVYIKTKEYKSTFDNNRLVDPHEEIKDFIRGVSESGTVINEGIFKKMSKEEKAKNEFYSDPLVQSILTPYQGMIEEGDEFEYIGKVNLLFNMERNFLAMMFVRKFFVSREDEEYNKVLDSFEKEYNQKMLKKVFNIVTTDPDYDKDTSKKDWFLIVNNKVYDYGIVANNLTTFDSSKNRADAKKFDMYMKKHILKYYKMYGKIKKLNT